MARWPRSGCTLGVNLRDLFPQHPVPDGWYGGRTVAVDGHNVAFRYLTSIRGRDGDMLRSKDGRVIGHLLGFMGLVRQMRERGAEPILVWDGPTHPRKQATVDERIRKREETLARAEAAKAAGDQALYKRLMRGTVWINPAMIGDCTRLMESLGVAVVTADHDGERYAAALCRAGHAQAVATEDYDALVAGAPAVLRRAGAQASFLHRLDDLATHGLTQEQLRQVAIVCGTDWHPGVKGFGAKTALKALDRWPDLKDLFSEVAAGRDDTRFHSLVSRGALSLQEFEDLEAFIRSLPEPARPQAARPCPEMASEVAVEMGLSAERALACFC